MLDSYSRGLPRKPSKKPCESGLYDDGKNCLERKSCKRISCVKNKNGCIECGSSIVKMNEDDRLYCDVNEEKVGKLCYKKCKNGYYAKGALCVKGIPNDIKRKIKDVDIETGLIPRFINFIRSKFVKSEKFENTGKNLLIQTNKETGLIDKLDNLLKSVLGKDLEEYRWYIFTLLVIVIILIVDYRKSNQTPDYLKIKYGNINNQLLEEFIREI